MEQKKFKTPFSIKQDQPSNPFSQQINRNVKSTPFNQKQKEEIDVSNDQSTLNQTNNSVNQIKINYFQDEEDDQLKGLIDLNEPQQIKEQVISDENEPPLLEDLGIDIENIKMKWMSVLMFKKCSKEFAEQSDMSGPLLLAMMLGSFLMLNGKIHFGYIYGFSVLGSLSIYCIMNFLSQNKNIELYNTTSILGYCLLPIVLLSFLALFFNLTYLFRGFIGLIFCMLSISWATYCSTQLFDQVLDLEDKKWLVAYPSCLFYATFVLITIF